MPYTVATFLLLPCAGAVSQRKEVVVRDYELMVVLEPSLDDASVEAVNTRIAGAVTRGGGSVQSTEAWGRRRLAYPIGRHRDGTYVLMRLRMDPSGAAELERTLKLTEAVMRHLLVRPTGVPASAPTPAPAPAPTSAAAESAVAGPA